MPRLRQPPAEGQIRHRTMAEFALEQLREAIILGDSRYQDALAAVVFSASPADVRHVMASGRWIVRNGAHATLDVRRELADALSALTPA